MREGKNCGKVIKVASRDKLLGTVHAPDEKAALKVAIKEVNIRPKDHNRVIVGPS
jgi:1,2-phenylacetyl-CoA epoxidase PaaB subunit